MRKKRKGKAHFANLITNKELVSRVHLQLNSKGSETDWISELPKRNQAMHWSLVVDL